MKKSSLWLVPACFFVVASILMCIGKICSDSLSYTVKPSLLPLLALTCMAYLAGKGEFDVRTAGLLLCAQLFGFAGDTFLLGSGFAMFASGMGAFLVGHIFYICLFGGRTWKGFGWKQWVPSLVAIGALLAVLIHLVGVHGALLVPMIVYGMALLLLIFSTLAGVFRIGGKTWWILLSGAVLFTASDLMIAMEQFDTLNFGLRPFVIIFTYLVAQALLATGAVRLALQKTNPKITEK
mgnify:CR=1 FL=1